ncbi:DUF397 domain-containing protein [Actinacidiphila sp. DG2A-62]|jgi:hypothetical protein|uniref:DUF397 domain-containing protein n=1 Tax=Actinacidiphila sp. DG2A-62 TaxID=3108821 RepID=UPI002DB7F3FE|nr:DUF397 domain-containing protein [Actinacidiphila sp. DG2A-62]MEC3993934.1 DUF397 domain-containing protein [Actinacidiphila sp. DG2A-62]
MTAPLAWQKSTYSQDQGDCVELAEHRGAVLLRESDNPTVVLTTTRQELAHFLQVIKIGATATRAPRP